MASLQKHSAHKLNTPKSSYNSYRNNNKKSVLLNKANIDSGYPQDIFSKLTPYKQNDYVSQNKKNLKNFFSDRLPAETVKKQSFKLQIANMDPAKIFQIKRQQYQLKNQTKITLHHSIQENTTKCHEIQKIGQLFYINDKNRQLKQKFGNVVRRDSPSGYSRDNHRKGTKSFIQKRSKIIKREAYEKVFGPDISSISSTLPIQKARASQLQVKHKSTSLPRRASHQTMAKKREQLSDLIKRMDGYKKKINPIKLDYNQPIQIDQNQFQNIQKSFVNDYDTIQNAEEQNAQNKSKMISLIKNITKMYKGHAIQQNRTKLNSLSDIQRIDMDFYLKMNVHKTNRLTKRIYQINKNSIPSSNNLLSRLSNTSDLFMSTHSRKQSILTITQNQSVLQQPKSIIKRRTLQQRFQYLGKNLVKAVLLADFYGVKKQFIFEAFWQSRQPYELEGSYAFFKAIKMGDIQCVKSFIKVDLNYLYQKDSLGKTALIYACCHNQTQVIKIILQKGCNVDKRCNNKKSALFYALQNQNKQAVKYLLKYGASPWSTPDYSYRDLLSKTNNQEIKIFFRNSRKVQLAVKLQLNNDKRKRFWHENKWRISQTKQIQF